MNWVFCISCGKLMTPIAEGPLTITAYLCEGCGSVYELRMIDVHNPELERDQNLYEL